MRFGDKDPTDDELKKLLTVIVEAGITTTAPLSSALMAARKSLKGTALEDVAGGERIVLALVLMMNAQMLAEASPMDPTKLFEASKDLREAVQRAGLLTTNEEERRRTSKEAASPEMKITTSFEPKDPKKESFSELLSVDDLMNMFNKEN